MAPRPVSSKASVFRIVGCSKQAAAASRIRDEPMTTTPAGSARRRSFWPWLLLLGVVAAGATWWFTTQKTVSASASAPPPAAGATLASSTTDTLNVPEDSVKSMKLTSVVAEASKQTHPLRLTGQLMLDSSRLVHVATRFGGEVMQLGVRGGTGDDANQTLRVGDHVKKGQRLAVLWSKEIGEKKSDLVDAISQLSLHQKLYTSLKSLQKEGGISARSAEEMQRAYESDLIQVERLRRTLRSWRLDEQELVEVENEAQRIRATATGDGTLPSPSSSPTQASATWADIDIRSPLDGVILEKNLTVGDIVNTDDDLFKVADLSRLVVMANVYEEDLPALVALPVEKRDWTVTISSMPELAPRSIHIMQIGNVIDPNQHSAVAKSWIDNSDGVLRVGQFIEATVDVPYAEELVSIPNTALLDDGPRKFIFIAQNENLTQLQRREVRVVRRTAGSVLLRGVAKNGVAPGERVLTSGVVELLSVLNDLAPPEPVRDEDPV
jgi:cobalt-zinc-cadmium efflux system membrane fusion protein